MGYWKTIKNQISRRRVHNQAVAAAPEVGKIKICIAGEEGDITLPTQENYDPIVLQALAADVQSNLSWRYPHGFQQQPLTVENIFVENDQA